MRMLQILYSQHSDDIRRFVLGGASHYQLDFLIPGISPLFAISLKQILHKLNFLINPRPRPHLKHLFFARVLNFGFFFALAICDSLAMLFYERHSELPQ